MIKKHIFIINGMARCGKDTFANIMIKYVPVIKYSSINRIKEIATECGWDGGKTEKDRKFLSDLKILTSEYNDLPFNCVRNMVELFNGMTSFDVLLIDIREPEEIERAKQEFGAKTILIKNDRVPVIVSNMADANVFNYDYDYIIENNGTLEEFEENIKKFIDDIINI